MTYKSPEKIKKMFNSIANKYDFFNNIISLGLHSNTKKRAINLLNIPKGAKVLDLCCGTGDISKFVKEASPNANIIALDFSENMLQLAQEKLKDTDIDFILADSTSLPFDNNTFDFVIISFGLRNIENYHQALDEIYRVLKKNGIFVHIDFGKENFFLDILFDKIVPILVKLFYGDKVAYEYLIKSKQNFFNQAKLQLLFSQHKFLDFKNYKFLLGAIGTQICKK